ncbi:MAG TPA: AsmA family protein [Terracidiphilus sp.]|nr:AsmA family protein [Terracidiphilus sp.]
MIEDAQERPRRHRSLWLAAALVGLVLVLIVVPPLIGISRYKNRITHLVSAALGRPVRLSGVELRLLPRPGFVLTDLTVEEDPAYGAEPVLHATSVAASIRFASLWRGKLQISRISVDEASLNLVRAGDGRWNLDSLFRNAVAGAGSARAVFHPYLEATNSRINVKNGLEKLPFSLLDADASLWQESDGQWRVRLRGQPARTDVSLDLADTGIVRIEGTLRPAPQFNQMLLHVDADWRDAQLGQLSRLLLGSDEGWRGDLRGELHLDGTAAAAQVQARLRATGVHREEFAPATPLDFDATCAFLFHYTSRSAEHLDCNSPIGDGRVRVTGNMPPAGQAPHLTLELDRIPAQAGLDVLRTVRRKVDASLQAAGAISGRLIYDPDDVSPSSAPQHGKTAARAAQNRAPAGPLTGNLTVDDLRITGDALSRPIQVARMTLEPAPAQPAEHTALTTSVTFPAGGPAPLTIRARLAFTGFQVGAHGLVSIARLREFAHIAGSVSEPALAQLAGEPANVDLEAAGPWLPPVEVTLSPDPAPLAGLVHANGTVVFHAANWKAPFLASAVLIHQATLHLENGAMRWDPVDFSYGPVKGSATLALPASCDPPATCAPQFTAHFGALDAAEVQGALLGVREKGTLLSSLLDRLKPSTAPAWPEADGTVQIDSLAAGVFTLSSITAEMKIAGSGAEVTSFDASAYGGQLHGAASVQIADQPQYTIQAAFTGFNPAAVGALLDMKWTGAALNGDGKLEMAGFTDKDLASSAKGTVTFDWRKGGVTGPDIPPALARFDKFDGEATIADGAITVGSDHLQRGGKTSAPHAEVSLAVPHKVTFVPSKH